MDSICATCGANEWCPYYNSDENVLGCQCDDALTVYVEDRREEYRDAWVKYVDKFHNTYD